MVRSPAASVVAASTLGLVVLLLTDAVWAGTAFAIVSLCLPVLLLLLADTRRGSRRLLWAGVVVTVLLLAGGFLGIVVLSGPRSTDPPAAALMVQVCVMTVAPLIALGVLYALDFSRFQPSRDDLERLRSIGRDDG
jgi:hypothetical protein